MSLDHLTPEEDHSPEPQEEEFSFPPMDSSASSKDPEEGVEAHDQEGEQAIKEAVQAGGKSTLQQILEWWSTMDKHDYPYGLYLITVAQFKAAASVPQKIEDAIEAGAKRLAEEIRILDPVKLQKLISSNDALARKLDKMEKIIEKVQQDAAERVAERQVKTWN
jgi:hypothetical protein